jgi:hypothetical protein
MEQSWVEKETAESNLGDARLNRRLGAMFEALEERPGQSLPTAFQDWSNTKVTDKRVDLSTTSVFRMGETIND